MSCGPSPVPSGYYRFTNSTGFSIGVPVGWQIQHVGHYVYIRDPADGGIFLLIDQSDQPQPNPLADWQQQAAARQGSYPGYHLIRLAAVSSPPAEKAALEALANAVAFDQIPPPKPGPSADRFQYRLTISDGDRRRTASFADGQVTPQMRPLLDRLLELAS